MAVVAFTSVRVGPGLTRITWTPLVNGDTGAPYHDFDSQEKAVQVFGTFGAGGTVSIQSTLEATATNYAIINDVQGNALTITAARIEAVQEPSGQIRPNVTAGDGTTSLTVILHTRKTWPGV